MVNIDKIKALAKEKGIKLNYITQQLGISHTFFADAAKGKVKISDNRLITIAEILNTTPEYLKDETDTKENLSDIFDIREVPKQGLIPVYGLVSAGKGIFAQEEILTWESVDKKYAKSGYFYLKVTGDSMSPKIDDGDLVLVRSQTSIDSGTIGIFSVEEEGFIKKVEYNDTHISLISFNPKYPPMEFDGMDVLKVRVIGKVIELKRKF